MAKKKLPNKLSMIVNVVLYLRVSSEEQAKYGFSIDNQRIDCTNFAERNGYHVVKVFTDDGKSAKDLNRPEAKEMLSYMGKSKNHIDALIVWRLDRLTRNTMDYHGEIRPFLDKHNIKLLSATEPNDETIEGELFRNIGIDFADYERKVIGKRTLAGMKQKASLGQYPHKAPVGYINITNPDKTKSIVIDKDRAFFVKSAFNLYDSGQYSLRSLTKKLYDDGFRNKKGNRLAKSCIERMLKNIFYTGVFEYEGTIRENAQHPAIISKELYYRVQDRFRDSNKTRKHDIDFAYTGLINCGHCGCQLTAELKKDRRGNPKYIYYHCTGNRGGDCHKDWTSEETLDNAISEVIKLIVIPMGVRENIVKGLKTIHEKKNDYSEQVKNNLLQQIKRLDNRIEQAYNDKLDGIRSYDEWKPLNDKWTAERDKLYIQLNGMNELDKQFYQKTDMLLGFTENVHEYFKKGNFDQRRRILEIISDGITYKDGELNIKLKPVFQSIVENQYISAQKMSNNRNTETGTIKGVEAPSTPLNEKFSPGWTRTSNPSINSRMLRH